MLTLYHGTTLRAWEAIIASQAILPLRESGAGPAQADFDNNPDIVSLSNNYAFFYALRATEKGNPPVVIKLEIPEEQEGNLWPDEDYIIYLATKSGYPLPSNINDAALHIRLHLKHFNVDWKQSLKGLGCVAFEGSIPFDWITAAVLIDIKKSSRLVLDTDPVIQPSNNFVMGTWYRNSLRWLFDPEAEMEEDAFFRFDTAVYETCRQGITTIFNKEHVSC